MPVLRPYSTGRRNTYTSARFTEHLEIEGICPSIDTAYDNSLMESIIGLFKTECIRTDVFHEGPYRHLVARPIGAGALGYSLLPRSPSG